MPLRLRMSYIRCIGIASLILLFSSCIYLPIPFWKTTPHASMRRVIVLDSETRKPLDDAEVIFFSEKWLNWFPPEAKGMCWGVDTQNPCVIERNVVERVAGRRIAPGTFDLPQKTHFCHFQIAGLCFVMGGVAHHSWTGQTLVSAKGFRSVWFSDRLSLVKPEDLPPHFSPSGPDRPTPNPIPFQFTPQGVIVSLEKKAQKEAQGGAQ